MKSFSKKIFIVTLATLFSSTIFFYINNEEKKIITASIEINEKTVQLTKNQKKAVELAKEAFKAYRQDGDIDMAKKLYEKSLSIDDRNKFTYAAYASIYCSNGNVNKALSILEGAQHKVDLGSAGYQILGLYADVLNKRALAIKYYKESIKRTREDDSNKILTLYFINPNLSLDKFNAIKPTKINKATLDHIKETSMHGFVSGMIRDACKQ